MTVIDQSTIDSLGLSGSSRSETRRDELGQAEFFKLMITQLQYQDPLDPADSGEFLGQLAQFATVNGIAELQQSFDSIANTMKANQALQAASMVGREVLIPAELAYLGEEGWVRGGVDLETSVDSLNIGIYNEAGELVNQVQLGAQASGLKSFYWNGLDSNGERAPEGIYEFRADARLDGKTSQPEVLLNAYVSSVRTSQGSGTVTLLIDGFGEVDLSKVRQIS
ncbi:flagellar hook capping protein [Ectothiorhodospira shaposhnikovii]|uniref:flagellar hook capping FlgD N-terminal domain-containing protein n=1 Tax=Ectothiorhodospira shaposhnikovii TaxID=1054 RepID=UPI0019054E19|nr:flagellar hook capping protein [Ectothiorhodospira shaposhnikovii]